MGLQVIDSTLVAVGSELANHADCCCEECGFFDACNHAITYEVAEADLPGGIMVGDVYIIDGECAEYTGMAACSGGATKTVGEEIDSCDDCDNCLDCDSVELPYEVTVVIPTGVPSRTGSFPNCNCQNCSDIAGTHTLPRNSTSGCSYVKCLGAIDDCFFFGGENPCYTFEPIDCRLRVEYTGASVTLKIEWYSSGDSTCTALIGIWTHSKTGLSDVPCRGDSVTLNSSSSGSGNPIDLHACRSGSAPTVIF